MTIAVQGRGRGWVKINAQLTLKIGQNPADSEWNESQYIHREATPGGPGHRDADRDRGLFIPPLDGYKNKGASGHNREVG